MSRKQRYQYFAENYPELFAAWESLPEYVEGMEVRCPTKNRDGTPISDDDVMGCGSPNVEWDGELYDCYDCGIFFCDFAADPPHRR